MPRSDKTDEALDGVFAGWHADHAHLSRAHVDPLTQLALHWIKRQRWRHVRLDTDKLAGFLRQVENKYSRSLPYHNLLHAMSVTHVAGKLLTCRGVDNLLNMAGPRDAEVLRLATFLAAVVHDAGHKGVTNEYLAATHDEYALVYGDEHAHERAHLAIAFRAFSAFPFMDLDTPEFSLLRRAMTHLVLATDMEQHSQIMAAFAGAHSMMMSRSAVPFGQGAAGGLDCLNMLAILLKSADLGHMAAPWDLHLSWVHRLRDELFQQGDRERARGWSVGEMYDREGTGDGEAAGILSMQVSFFTVVVLPMYQALTLLIPGAHPLLEGARANLKAWAVESGPEDT